MLSRVPWALAQSSCFACDHCLRPWNRRCQTAVGLRRPETRETRNPPITIGADRPFTPASILLVVWPRVLRQLRPLPCTHMDSAAIAWAISGFVMGLGIQNIIISDLSSRQYVATTRSTWRPMHALQRLQVSSWSVPESSMTTSSSNQWPRPKRLHKLRSCKCLEFYFTL